MQIASLTLADGQPEPTAHVFSVSSAQQGTSVPASWDDRSGDMISGYSNITMSVRKTANSSYKVQMRITDPTLDTLGTVVHKTLCVIDFTLPVTSTLQNRKDILAYARNLLANAIVVDAVHNLSPAY